MLKQSTQRRFFSIELIRASLLRLIGVVRQRYQGDLLRLAGAEVCRRERHDAVAQLVRHISAHLSQRIGLHDVAAALGMSPNNVTSATGCDQVTRQPRGINCSRALST
jgi:transcriptional regulator GlxA family with amidase domain